MENGNGQKKLEGITLITAMVSPLIPREIAMLLVISKVLLLSVV